MPHETCQGADTSRKERVPQNEPCLSLSVHQAPTGPRGKSATNTPGSAQQAWDVMFLTLNLSCRFSRELPWTH